MRRDGGLCWIINEQHVCSLAPDTHKDSHVCCLPSQCLYSYPQGIKMTRVNTEQHQEHTTFRRQLQLFPLRFASSILKDSNFFSVDFGKKQCCVPRSLKHEVAPWCGGSLPPYSNRVPGSFSRPFERYTHTYIMDYRFKMMCLRHQRVQEWMRSWRNQADFI